MYTANVLPAVSRQRRSVLSVLASFAAVLVAVLCAAPASAANQSKIAVIDLRTAMMKNEDGLRVQSKLKQLFESRQNEIETKQKAIQKAKKDLDRQAKARTISEKKLQKKLNNLRQQAAQLQATAYQYEIEVRRQETELTTPIMQKLMALIKRLANQNGYDMVVDKAAVPYFRSDLDVTDRIIQLYNSGIGTTGKKKTKARSNRSNKRPRKRPSKRPSKRPRKK